MHGLHLRTSFPVTHSHITSNPNTAHNPLLSCCTAFLLQPKWLIRFSDLGEWLRRPLVISGRSKTFLFSLLQNARTVSWAQPSSYLKNTACYKGKGKAIPGQALRVPVGSGSQISTQSTHKGDKVVNPTHRPPLPHRKYSWYSFLLEAKSTPGPQSGQKDYVNEKFK